MSPSTILLTAMLSLTANKMRAGLTLLGVVIGVAAVITLMAIGEGVQQSITQRIESLGTNLLFVRPGSSSQGGISGGQGSAATLTLEERVASMEEINRLYGIMATRLNVFQGRTNNRTLTSRNGQPTQEQQFFLEGIQSR